MWQASDRIKSFLLLLVAGSVLEVDTAYHFTLQFKNLKATNEKE